MQKSSRLIGGDGTGGDVTEADQDTQLEEQLKETGQDGTGGGGEEFGGTRGQGASRFFARYEEKYDGLNWRYQFSKRKRLIRLRRDTALYKKYVGRVDALSLTHDRASSNSYASLLYG